jgi:hypothetical protein
MLEGTNQRTACTIFTFRNPNIAFEIYVPYLKIGMYTRYPIFILLFLFKALMRSINGELLDNLMILISKLFPHFQSVQYK